MISSFLGSIDWYQVFWGVLIDLIIGFLVLIIKTFDNQTEIWSWLSNPLIIKLFEMLMIIMIISCTKRSLTNQTNQTKVCLIESFFSTVKVGVFHVWDKTMLSSVPSCHNESFVCIFVFFILVSVHVCICLTRFKITSYNFDTVHTTCRTPTCHGSVCYSPVTIWNIPRVHTGEINPTMDSKECFDVLTRSSVPFFPPHADGQKPVSQELSHVIPWTILALYRDPRCHRSCRIFPNELCKE